jgi:hypothetical protein
MESVEIPLNEYKVLYQKEGSMSENHPRPYLHLRFYKPDVGPVSNASPRTGRSRHFSDFPKPHSSLPQGELHVVTQDVSPGSYHKQPMKDAWASRAV